MKSILGPGGKNIALLIEEANVIKILTPGGRLLGVYYKDKDMTLTPCGSLIGYGNQLFSLIEE